jgi:hypothetical protein
MEETAGLTGLVADHRNRFALPLQQALPAQDPVNGGGWQAEQGQEDPDPARWCQMGVGVTSIGEPSQVWSGQHPQPTR